MKPTLIFLWIVVYLAACNESDHFEKDKMPSKSPANAVFSNGMALSIYDTNNFRAVKMEFDLRGMNRNTYEKPNHLMRFVEEIFPVNLKKHKSENIKDFLAKSGFLVRPWVLEVNSQADLIDEADARYQEFVSANKNHIYINQFRRYGATVMLRDFDLLHVSTKKEIKLSRYYLNELLQAKSLNFGLYYHSIKQLSPYLTAAEKTRHKDQILKLSKNATLNVNIILEQEALQQEIAMTKAMFEKMANRAKDGKERALFLEKASRTDSVVRKRTTDFLTNENQVNSLYIRKLVDL